MSTEANRPERSLDEILAEMEQRGHPEGQKLLEAIQARLPELEALLEKVSSLWHAEDGFYRFYHQSFKVYHLQSDTERIVQLLRSLMPERPLNSWFEEIIRQGTGRRFEMEHNQRWMEETRPILEAFFHARMMLELALQYGKELEKAPAAMRSGWAAFLCLYGLR